LGKGPAGSVALAGCGRLLASHFGPSLPLGVGDGAARFWAEGAAGFYGGGFAGFFGGDVDTFGEQVAGFDEPREFFIDGVQNVVVQA
jgi:hypothetical protein